MNIKRMRLHVAGGGNMGAALVAGLLLAGPRRVFRDPWLWGSAGLALLIWAPNLIWQASNGWPQLELSAAIAGGSSGSSQPWSNISRCQRRAQSGTWLLDPERSSASESSGRCSSRNATNSERNASTSASKVSCTSLPADQIFGKTSVTSKRRILFSK